MDDVFVRCVDTPDRVHEFVVPGADGYNIYIDEKLDEDSRIKAYHHAMHHIENGDFNRRDVQEIESRAHRSLDPDFGSPGNNR